MGSLSIEDRSNIERWKKFRQASSTHSEVRKCELKRTLELIAANPGDSVLEVGTGGCYLTFPISRQVQEKGHLVTADVNRIGLEEFLNKKRILEDVFRTKLPIEPYLFSDAHFESRKFPESYNSKFDIVASLATFHHFDCRAMDIKSGITGRTNALKEFFTMLKPGGRLIIADVGHGSSAQQYFDAIDNPRHFYPLGHAHDFFTPNEFRFHLEKIGFSVKHLAIEEVPWVFESKEHCMEFLCQMHNAKCPPEEVFDIATRILGFESRPGYFALNWQLMFLEATK